MADNLYLFYGNDEYLVSLNARKKVDEVCPESEQTLSLEIIDGDAGKIDDAVAGLDRCLAAFRTVGLFGGDKVVWLRNATFFKNAVIMKNEQVKRLLGELASDIKAGLAEGQFLIISAPGIDKRAAFYKAVDAAVSPELRTRIYDLCEKLFHSCGLQTSVPKYYASGAERGAFLDFVDYPLNNRWWLEDEFKKVAELTSETEKAAQEKNHVNAITAWNGCLRVRVRQSHNLFFFWKRNFLTGTGPRKNVRRIICH